MVWLCGAQGEGSEWRARAQPEGSGHCRPITSSQESVLNPQRDDLKHEVLASSERDLGGGSCLSLLSVHCGPDVIGQLRLPSVAVAAGLVLPVRGCFSPCLAVSLPFLFCTKHGSLDSPISATAISKYTLPRQPRTCSKHILPSPYSRTAPGLATPRNTAVSVSLSTGYNTQVTILSYNSK